MTHNETFTFGGFYDTLAEVCNLVGELWMVDAVLDLVDKMDEGNTQATVLHDVEIGETAPFTVKVHLSRDRLTDFDNQVTTSRVFAESMIELHYQDHADAVERIAALQPDPLDEAVHAMNRAVDAVGWSSDGRGANQIADDFGKIDDVLTVDWEGSARDSFKRNFYDPFHEIRATQAEALLGAGRCIAATRGVMAASQHSLMNVVSAAKSQLVKQLEARAASQTTDPSAEDLAVLSSALAVIASATFAIPPASAAAGALSAMVGYAATQVPPRAVQKVRVDAVDAMSIRDWLATALAKVNSTLDGQLDSIEAEVGRDGRSIGDRALFPPPPRSIIDVSPGGFHHVSSPRE